MKYTQIKVKEKKKKISGEGAIPGTPKRVPSQRFVISALIIT